MSLENSDGDKGYAGDDDHDKQNKRKTLLGKKTDGKKGQKDKGYVMFDEDDSDESLVTSEDVRSPSKHKKPKGFKFSTKKKDKEKDKEKEEKKEVKKEIKEKEKKKEGKEHKKHKKDKKKNKTEEPVIESSKDSDKAIFGVPLMLAVERNRCYDGIELPVMFRECIDYIEEHGLSCEGIYRISGVKSKIQQLKDCYNKGLPVFLEEHEPNIVASLLKQFLRELPEPVLTISLMPKFEEASTLKSEKSKVEKFNKLIHDLPKPNRLLLSWMIVHMTHVIERQKENKMSLQNVSIVLSPTMQISHRVLNVLFSHVKQLFKHTELKKYKPPLRPAHSKWSLELPDNPAQLEEELLKQEALLNNLHEQLQSGVSDQEKEEQLWEVQRVVTQLKRKIKMARKGDVKRKSEEVKKQRNSQEEELKLELKEIPLKQLAAQAQKPANQTTDNKTKKEVTKQPAPQPPSESKEKEEPKTSEEISKPIDTQPAAEVVQEKVEEKQDEAVAVKQEAELEKEGSESKIETDTPPSLESVSEEITETKQEVEEEKRDQKEKSEQIEVTEKKRIENENKIEVTETKRIENENQIEEENLEVKIEHTTTEEESPDSSADEFEQQVEQILEQQKDIQAKESSDESDETIEEEVDTRELSKDPSTESTVDADLPTDTVESVSEIGEQPVAEVPAQVPEQFNTAEQDVAEFITVHDTDTVFVEEDEELLSLQQEEHKVRLEEEELLAIESELRTKIETEKNEIERLHQEITELQYLRQDSDLEEYSSTSDSSSDSEDEEDLQEILNELLEKNEALEKNNADLCSKIHEERMICLAVKVEIRMLQQKQLENSANDFDLLW